MTIALHEMMPAVVKKNSMTGKSNSDNTLQGILIYFNTAAKRAMAVAFPPIRVAM